MTTEAVKTPEALAESEQAPAAEEGKSSRFKLGSKKVKILAMLAGMMGVYAVVGYLFIPKPAEESSAEETEEGEGGAHSEHGVSKVEVELGDGSFATTNEQAVTGISIQVRFKLFVTVAEKEQEEFQHLVEAHKNRINEAIIGIFRAASHDDLRDPELNVMKQKIREKVNRLLGTTAIIDVVFSGYSKMEQ